MKIQVRLSQTPSARKAFRIPTGFRAAARAAMSDVAHFELATLQAVHVSLVMMSDEELLALNQSSLGHDWYTDVITFELERTDDMLETEIYMSVDRARANAKRARISLERELLHLAIHGVLHLAGHDDHAPAAKKLMKRRERFFLGRIDMF